MKKMGDGKVIQFPFKGKVPANDIKIDSSAMEVRENIIFTENLTEALVVNLIHNMAENGVDVDSEGFICDTSFLIELVKSMVYRDLGMKHPMQGMADMFVNSTKDGNRIHVEVDVDFIQDVVDDINNKDEEEE